MKTLIGPSSFAALDAAPLNLLREAGLEVIPNPWGRRYTKEEIISLLDDVDTLIAGLEPLDREVLENAPKLRVISRCGAGMDNVDLEAAEQLGIAVRNTPDGPTDSVAEMTVANMLAVLRLIPQINESMRKGEWDKRIGGLLGAKTVVVVGYGRIGRRVTALVKAFGSRVIRVDPHVETTVDDVEAMGLEEALPLADVVTLHLSGGETILDRKAFRILKRGAIVLNAARGTSVDEAALIQAIDDGIVAGGWLDAFSVEPYDGQLREYPQLILTPHIASYTREGRLRMETQCAENLLEALASTKPK